MSDQQQVISAGEVVQISPLVRRITAPNGGPMTGPGTNTYLLGTEQIAVIDPGPADATHVEAILAAANGGIRWIIVTHTHEDHSPAAAVLAEATGAAVMGNSLLENDGFQDDSFISGHSFEHKECLQTDEFSLCALLTPGHVGNHVCYLLENEGMLFSGDHIMQGSSVVIVPPHGDMQAYLDSLSLLFDYAIMRIAPGHGFVIEEPVEEIERLIKHRLYREQKVIDVMRSRQSGDLDTLTPFVYDNVDSSLHPIAKYSLWAHLVKLEREKRVSCEGDHWTFHH